MDKQETLNFPTDFSPGLQDKIPWIFVDTV